MTWRHIRTIWFKELLDTFRDRRTLYAMLIAPLIIMPLLMLGGPLLMVKQDQKARQEATPITIVGAENAPGLVKAMEDSDGFRLVGERHIEEGLRKGRTSLVIRIPQGFEQKIVREEAVDLELFYEARQQKSTVALDKAKTVISGYTQSEVAKRLGRRGMNTALLTPVHIKVQNVATNQEMGGLMLAFLIPYLMGIWTVTGGMYTAIDSVAGEKERNTLEGLVVCPPSRWTLTLGKFLAVFTIATLTVIVAVGSMILSYKFGVPAILGERLVNMAVSPGGALVLVGISLFFIAMISALEIVLSAFGRSFKETQNYMTVLMFAVMIPGMLFVFMPNLKLPLVAHLIPVINVFALSRDVLMGQMEAAKLLTVVGSSAIYAAFSLMLAARTFNSEKVLFKG